MNKLSTPFGVANSVTYYDPEKSIAYVSTPEHECYGVKLTRAMPECLGRVSISEGDWRWFDGDIAWSAVVVAFPEFFSTVTQEVAKGTLRDEFPRAYEEHFQVQLTAADSRALEQAAWEDRTRNNFIVCTGWDDVHWDIPAGHVYARGWRREDEHTAGFLLPKADYEAGGLRLVLDGYPRWEPDRSLPYSKPRHAQQEVTQ